MLSNQFERYATTETVKENEEDVSGPAGAEDRSIQIASLLIS
jgi:hypothetical protein